MSGTRERDLHKEIQYLSKLIRAHKQSSIVHKPTPTPHTRSHRSTQHKFRYSSQLQSVGNKSQGKRVYHGNRVYKPAESGSEQPAGDRLRTELSKSSTANVASLSLSGTALKAKSHKNFVYRPNVTSVSSSVESSKVRTNPVSSQNTQTKKAEELNVAKPTGSKFRWKRKSLSDDKTSGCNSSSSQTPERKVLRATPKRAGSHRNTKYKWRRRSSSGSKDKSVRTPISPLIAQSKFKLTRASLLRQSSNSPFAHRGGTFRQRRLSYRKKHTPLSQRFKSLHTPSRKRLPRKSKNKVWIADKQEKSSQAGPSQGTTASAVGTVQSHPSVFAGREVKTARGNKQWVASSLTGRTHRKSNSGLVSLRGDSFVQDRSGKKLKRLSSSSKLAQAVKRRSVSEVAKSPSVKQFLASRAVRKSKLYVWNSKHKDKSKQYCMFFNRFGKCNHRDTCPYIHDPDKIAVCTKFLRGVCDKTDGSCTFSHKISKEKMPVCSFFLRGVCTKDQCPYLHVSVGREADICMDFVRGYCPRGEECTMQHVLDCLEFLEKGVCSRGKACPLRHRQRLYKIRQEKAQQTKAAPLVSAVKEPYAFKLAARRHNKERKNDSLDTSDLSPTEPATAGTTPTPFDFSAAPDFIAL